MAIRVDTTAARADRRWRRRPNLSGESPGASPVRTIKLCPATTTRPTTLRIAIDRSIVELARTGRTPRPISLTTATTASA
jgi:hypothetical protein